MERAVVILLIVFAWAQMAACGCCPDFWTEFNSYCYRSIAERKTWTTAGSSCRTFGAELASIHSSAENDFVYDLWVLPNTHADTDTFFWSDGTTVDYLRWDYGEPNNYHNQDCIQIIKYNKQWNDRACGDMLAYVCKKPLE
ncbi:C-type lectin domain family 19 member A-like [Diadema antillarum]|uniref:C-type lectin domain family 19 member A-like n=1 Tax=Diadema antillarum TaxID=105358 RepID=UPI003A8621A2